MEENIRKFSINDIDLFNNDEDIDFAIAELEFISDGNNGQNSPITLEALKRDAKTVLGKPIVAKYEKYLNDVTTHVTDEIIIGWCPNNSEITFRKHPDGRTFAVCQAVISKLYATEVFLLFKEDNYRSVSAEFTAHQPNPNEYGEGLIDGFDIRAITILGKSVPPAIKDANIQIKRFSQEDAVKFYNDHNENPLKLFAEKRRKEMESPKTYKVNKTELKETPWGDIDKTELRDKVMSAKNKSTLVHTVYAVVDDDWENAPSTNLKYPLMELSGDTFYYNRNALSSALAYAKQEDEKEVIAKVEKLYKKFKLGLPNDDKKEDDRKENKKEMAENKKFSQLEGREVYAEVIKRVQAKLGKGMYVEEIYSDHVEVRKESTGEILTIPADIKIGKDDEKMSISIDYDAMKKSGEQKQFADKKEEDKKKEKEFEDKDDIEEEADEDLDDEEDEAEKETKKASKKDKTKKDTKKYSLDVHADEGAFLAMLESETEDMKELANEFWSAKDDQNIIMEKVLSMAKEMAKLKEFKAEKDAKDCEVEFTSCMSKVKGDIDEKEYAKLYEEGKDIKDFEKMKEFSLKVKAFAYDNREETGFFKFAGNQNIRKDSAEDDAFVRILNKKY